MAPIPSEMVNHQPFESLGQRKLIFFHGKGGVGRTTLSKAWAQVLSNASLKTPRRVLWVCFQSPLETNRSSSQITPEGPGLWSLHCEATVAFEEYIGLKLRIPAIAKLFARNQLIQYLAQAGPGVHEIVLLGKVWFEKEHFDHIVVDLPSTGYGLALFNSTRNFTELFKRGPIHDDAVRMLETFSDAQQSAHVICALPEEMPLQEGLETSAALERLFPTNSPAFIVNKNFPYRSQEPLPQSSPNPMASSAIEFCERRSALEQMNLELWTTKGISYTALEMEETPEAAPAGVARQFTRFLKPEASP